MEFKLNKEEKIILLKTARNTISSLFGSKPLEEYKTTDTLSVKCGAFVTLHKKNGSLRGCIGHITQDKPLIDTVKEMAIASSTQDPRFPHLRKEDLPNIIIEISVLSPFRQISSIDEIEVGKHGILMQKGYRSGLLLPQVATEYNWDRETFLTHTCYKAGLDGSCWKNEDTIIEIFHAIVFSEKDLI
jgi:uncharacterized protein